MIDIFPYIFEFMKSDLPVAMLFIAFIAVAGLCCYGARRMEEN